MALDANSLPPPDCSGFGTRVGSRPVIARGYVAAPAMDLGVVAVVASDYIRRNRGL
jgi:hypothetical protein